MSEIAAPKPDLDAKAEKKTILKHFLKGFLKGKFLPWKLRKSTRKSLSQPGCSHSNTIYDVQLQKTIVLRMQPRHRLTLSTQGVVLRLPPQNIAHATFMRPLQCDLQPQLQETHRTTHTGTTTCCKTHRRNQSRPERPQPQPPHRRGTFHRRLQPLYMEKHKVSCSRLPPQCNIHVAITMRLATTASRNA